MDALALRFAATKIQPPRVRAARLARPALEAALAEALTQARVVLLQAGAGFGKTSALAAALAALPADMRCAWVSLDADDDAPRLLACLAAALEPFDLPWRVAPEVLPALAADARGTPARAVAELVNALAASEAAHGVIVLDDLHRIGDEPLLRALDLLIERLPPQWTLVLATRVAPPLALARQRAAGELIDFDQERLRFSAAEVQTLATAEGAGERASALALRTGGWPAGVRLALNSASSPAGPRGERALFDYLASEVLDQLPAPLHDFLLRVSVLPEFTAASGAAVSGDAQAALRMDEIERRGLFATALTTDERTLVLHDLFRDALQERARRQLGDAWPELLRRAARASADPLRRVGHLLRIPDWAAAEQALAEQAEALLMRGGRRDVERTLAVFDRGWAQSSPVLRRIAAMCAFLRWDWQACADEAQAAARLARARSGAGELSNGDADELARAQAYLAHALYALDRNDEALAVIAELRAREATLPMAARLGLVLADAMQRLRAGDLPQLPAMYADVLALLEGPGSSDYHWWEGALPINWTTLPGMRALAARYLRGAWARVADAPLPIAADLHVLEAFNHLWAGRLDAAHASAAQAEEDLRWLAVSGESEVGLRIFRVLDGAVRGDVQAVQATLQQLQDREREEHGASAVRVRLWRHQMAIYGVRASDLLDLGADAIAHWAAMLKENPLVDPAPANARAVGTRARFAAAEGRWADAAVLFAQLLPPRSERLDVMGQAIELQLRAAHAFVRCGRLDDAAQAAVPALERIARDGEPGQALLAGARVLGELAATAWGARVALPLQAVLADAAALALRARGDAPIARPSAPTATADGALSEREREVLGAIAEGQSNKLIARELDISPHTVKRHVANILDKLALASRGQAAAWWREHARI